MREHKPALSVVRLHVEDPVHADRGARLQAVQQALAAGVPQRVAQPAAAELGLDDELAMKPNSPP
ncbi:MAG: hypothetical protein R2844_17465 [Caldilineales bacterium]